MRTTRKRPQGRVLGALTVALALALLVALLLAGAALAAAKPGTPTATTPKGTIASTTPSFTWSKAKGAARYELRVYQGSTQVLKMSGLKKTFWQAAQALPTNVDLTWKVRASNTAGAGAWSRSLAFKVVPPSPDPPVSLVMVPVPAGTFQLADPSSDEGPSTVSAFSMSEKEITAEQFTAVTGLANPSTYFTTVVNGPVLANWYHALVFCNMLSMREGLTPVYSIMVSGTASTDPAAWGTVPTETDAAWNAAIPNWSATGYRLPTEMEYMWAAMGATGATTGYLKAFAGSTGTNAIGDYVWYMDNAGWTTHTVGTKLPNELGLYDMSGNVWEWCWDWLAVYPHGALSNYRGPDEGDVRVVRGGAYDCGGGRGAVGDRGQDDPYSQDNRVVGLRVVRL